jgi:hypothetical protein
VKSGCWQRPAPSNRSLETDTLLQGAAGSAGGRTSRGALQQRAGQL